MSEKVFPRTKFNAAGEVTSDVDGLLLRDYFAGLVLSGIFASGGHARVAAEIAAEDHAFCLTPTEIGKVAERQIAVMAYSMSDAMLEARKDGAA